jgi:thymidylate kinase
MKSEVNTMANQNQNNLKSQRGKFIVIDGLDGVGKGVFLDALATSAKNDGKQVVNVNDFWSQNNFHPTLEQLHGKVDVLLTSEPTYAGIGRYIREEIIFNNGRNYSPETTAQAYALDRQILYQQLVLPALAAGIDVYQSRSFSTSIVYQRQQAIDEGRKFDVDQIMSIPGNAFCAKYPMDFLIVPTITDVEEAIRRSQNREKKDYCKFENLPFQLKLKPQFESEEFRNFFESLGTKVVYVDAGRSKDFSKLQMFDFYERNLSSTPKE